MGYFKPRGKHLWNSRALEGARCVPPRERSSGPSGLSPASQNRVNPTNPGFSRLRDVSTGSHRTESGPEHRRKKDIRYYLLCPDLFLFFPLFKACTTMSMKEKKVAKSSGNFFGQHDDSCACVAGTSKPRQSFKNIWVLCLLEYSVRVYVWLHFLLDLPL